MAGKVGDAELNQQALDVNEEVKAMSERLNNLTSIDDSIDAALKSVDQELLSEKLKERLSSFRDQIKGKASLDKGDQEAYSSLIQEIRRGFFNFSNGLVPSFFSASPANDFKKNFFSDYSISQLDPFSGAVDFFESPVDKSTMLKITENIEDKFATGKTKVKAYLGRKKGEVSGLLAKQKSELEQKKSQLHQLYDQLDKRKNSQANINESLVNFGIPATGIVMIALLAIPIFYRHDAAQQYILCSGLLIQIFTIFLLTSTIFILGFAGKIDTNSLGTLLGGISGFVLGRGANSKKTDTAGAGAKN